MEYYKKSKNKSDNFKQKNDKKSNSTNPINSVFFYDKNLPQFTERALFERKTYDNSVIDFNVKSSKKVAKTKSAMMANGLLEQLGGKKSIPIKIKDIYKANQINQPLSETIDNHIKRDQNKKKNINFNQYPYIIN